MLSTSGLSPVAQENSAALRLGWSGSAWIPVAPESPITTIESRGESRGEGEGSEGGGPSAAEHAVSRAPATTAATATRVKRRCRRGG